MAAEMSASGRPARFTASSRGDGGEDAIARGGMVGEDHVSGLFPAERETAGAERFEHVPVSHCGLDHVDPSVAHRKTESEVGHHRDDDGVVTQFSTGAQIVGDDADDVVAVDDLAGVIDGDQPIGITVERDADICAVLDHSGSDR